MPKQQMLEYLYDLAMVPRRHCSQNSKLFLFECIGKPDAVVIVPGDSLIIMHRSFFMHRSMPPIVNESGCYMLC
jgi:hypothetical protein